ncbi:hypothetical protein CDA30_13920, partial [Klebsiella pneumoniae]
MRASVIAFGSLLIQQYAHNQQYGHAHRHNTDINNHSVRQKLQLNGYGGQVKAHLIVVKTVSYTPLTLAPICRVWVLL